MQKARSSLKKLFGVAKYEDPILETEYQLWIRKTWPIFSKVSFVIVFSNVIIISLS